MEEFIRDFKSSHSGDRLEALDVDSRDGAATASLYDIMQYPAVLALRDDGSIAQSWVGDMLPVQNELAYYTYSA